MGEKRRLMSNYHCCREPKLSSTSFVKWCSITLMNVHLNLKATNKQKETKKSICLIHSQGISNCMLSICHISHLFREKSRQSSTDKNSVARCIFFTSGNKSRNREQEILHFLK